MSDRSCSHCESRDSFHLGHCKVCLKEVCSDCGNVQTSQTAGDIVVHNACLEARPDILGNSFRFLRLKGSR